MKLKALFICILLLFFEPKIYGNNPYLVSEIKQKLYRDTIPIEIEGGLIFIQVKIGGDLKKFMFDLGAPLCVSDSLISKANCKILDTVNVHDPNSKSSQALVVNIPSFELGNLQFTNSAGLAKSLSSIPLIRCYRMDGVIGSNILNNSVVQIDLKNKWIILSDNSKGLVSQGMHKSQLYTDIQGRPIFDILISNSISIKCLFDSGLKGFLKLDSLSVLEGINNFYIKKEVESMGNASFGINSTEIKKVPKSILHVNDLSLGKFKIEDIMIKHNALHKNIIGVELCEYGIVTLDFKKKNFYFLGLEQTQKYTNNISFGFELDFDSSFYSIGYVLPNSIADRNGLKTGQRLIKINNIDFRNKNIENECYYVLSDIMRQKSIKLIVLNNDSTETTITLDKP